MESIENLEPKNLNFMGSFEKILDTIFSECPDGIVYKDKRHRYLSANSAFCQLYNVNPSNFLGSNKASFLSKENQKLVNDVNQIIDSEHQAINYTMNLKEKILNITSSPILHKNEFIGTISIIKDVTQEENIKEKFVFKHYQLKSLLENIPMLIYMQDKNLNYLTGTKSSKNFVENGYDAFSNIYLDISKHKEEETNENQHVLKKNECLTKEKEFLDFKERQHWYKIYKVPLKDYFGNPTGIITVANNIDSEKQLQQQRETFVASIGHDLKNPTLAQIRGLELLLKGNFGEISSEQRELIEMVLDSCRYMNGMLSTLLATYRNEGGTVKLNVENFNFGDLIKECVDEMIYVAKDKDITIKINNSFSSNQIFADRIQIKRVVMNLLSNGIKYAFKNTNLELSIFKKKDFMHFEFKNQSPYIPSEKQKSIFAQYVSYASSHKELGIGLGLYASKKIIEGHNGNIYVQSFKNNSNIFGFTIPLQPKSLTLKDVYL